VYSIYYYITGIESIEYLEDFLRMPFASLLFFLLYRISCKKRETETLLSLSVLVQMKRKAGVDVSLQPKSPPQNISLRAGG
jgi:uncharacterized membrane protein